MFDFIARNIFVLLPLAIFIGIRILEARRKAQGQKPQLFDEDEDSTGPQPGAAPWRDIYTPPVFEPVKQQPVPAPKKKPVKQKALQLTGKPLTGDILKETDTKQTQGQASNPAQAQGKNNIFQKIELLSPLQQAVALAEILGPPKGF